MRVDFLLHHGHHVERVPHCVEAQDLWQSSETSPVKDREILLSFSVILIHFLLKTQELNRRNTIFIISQLTLETEQ